MQVEVKRRPATRGTVAGMTNAPKIDTGMSPGWLYRNAGAEVRSELRLSAPCFQEGQFDRAGEMRCIHEERPCWKELFCECLGIIILMPRTWINKWRTGDIKAVAQQLAVEPWAVEFRRLIAQARGE